MITICLIVTINFILGIIILILLAQKPYIGAPPLPGISQSGERPKIILAQDIDYPPFAYLGVPPDSDYTLAGLAVDIARGLP
jgi:hypothetical protein